MTVGVEHLGDRVERGPGARARRRRARRRRGRSGATAAEAGVDVAADVDDVEVRPGGAQLGGPPRRAGADARARRAASRGCRPSRAHRASRGSSRSGTAPMTSPSAGAVGRSLSECTATSQRPSSSASRRAVTKTPVPPRLARRPGDPVALGGDPHELDRGRRPARGRRRRVPVWVRARALARVPTRTAVRRAGAPGGAGRVEACGPVLRPRARDVERGDKRHSRVQCVMTGRRKCAAAFRHGADLGAFPDELSGHILVTPRSGQPLTSRRAPRAPAGRPPRARCRRPTRPRPRGRARQRPPPRTRVDGGAVRRRSAAAATATSARARVPEHRSRSERRRRAAADASRTASAVSASSGGAASAPSRRRRAAAGPRPSPGAAVGQPQHVPPGPGGRRAATATSPSRGSAPWRAPARRRAARRARPCRAGRRRAPGASRTSVTSRTSAPRVGRSAREPRARRPRAGRSVAPRRGRRATTARRGERPRRRRARPDHAGAAAAAAVAGRSPVTRAPVRTVPRATARSSHQRVDSACTPPTSPRTAEPGAAPRARSDADRARRATRCRASAASSPGATACDVEPAGSAPRAPRRRPASTSRSSTRRPIRARTSGPRGRVGVDRRRAGSTRSSARAQRAGHADRAPDVARPRVARGCRARRRAAARRPARQLAPTAPSAGRPMTCVAQPELGERARATAPPRVANDSAPASSVEPADHVAAATRRRPAAPASSTTTRSPRARERARRDEPADPAADDDGVRRAPGARRVDRPSGGHRRVDQLDHAGQHRRVGLRRHAVAEVDHVAGRLGAAGDDVAHVRLEHRPRRGQQRGVDVALQRRRAAQPAVRLVERRPVVDADDVRAGVAACAAAAGARAGAEVDAPARRQVRDVRTARGPTTARRAPRSPRATATRPRSRTAARRWRPPSTCARRNAPVTSAAHVGRARATRGVGVHQGARGEVVARRAGPRRGRRRA